MRRVKKPKPLGASAAHHTSSDKHEMQNQHCHRVACGRRRAGAFKSDLSNITNERASAEEIGQGGTQDGPECDGFGGRWYA